MVPYKHLEKAIDLGILKHYTGNLPSGWCFEKYGHHLYPERQTLYAYYGFGGDFELKAESPSKFFLAVFPDFLQVEFEADTQGKLIQTSYIQGNIKHSMKKF